MRAIVLTLTCTIVICGCSMRGSSNMPAPGGFPPFTEPQVIEKGAGAEWARLTPHTLGALGAGIVRGPDGNMWFIDENAGDLVRLSMSGGFKEFSMGSQLGGSAIALTVGADNKFYVANESAKIVRVTTSGVVKSFTTKTGDNTELGALALGPDGNVWFPETAHLGSITPTGVITEFAYPAGFSTPNQFGTIATGADNNLWFNESGDNSIVRFVIATHSFKEFKIASSCTPVGLVKARDNNIWFTCIALPRQVGRITTAGVIKLFPGGGAFSGEETFQISTLGPDGQPWFSSSDTGSIFRIDTATGKVTFSSPPFMNGERPDSVASGPDGNIWVTTIGLSNVYVRVLHPLKLTPLTLTFASSGLSQNVVVSQSGTASWTATSSNTAVATVTQGSPADTFVVKSVAPGTCSVKIADAIGNSAQVHVTVK